MNDSTQWKHLVEMLTPRQQTFDFTRSDIWQQLPREAQHACVEVIATLLYQVISDTLRENHDE